MAATGDIGYKDRLEYETLPTGSGSWNTVYQVRTVTAPKKTIKKVDFSNLESPNRTSEYKAGFGEYSPASFEAVYDPANATQGQILTDGDSGTQRNWRIILRNSISGATEETWTWLGHVGEAGLATISNEEPHMLTGSVEVDGAITIT
jgi:hypothetical protein